MTKVFECNRMRQDKNRAKKVGEKRRLKELEKGKLERVVNVVNKDKQHTNTTCYGAYLFFPSIYLFFPLFYPNYLFRTCACSVIQVNTSTIKQYLQCSVLLNRIFNVRDCQYAVQSEDAYMIRCVRVPMYVYVPKIWYSCNGEASRQVQFACFHSYCTLYLPTRGGGKNLLI